MSKPQTVNISFVDSQGKESVIQCIVTLGEDGEACTLTPLAGEPTCFVSISFRLDSLLRSLQLQAIRMLFIEGLGNDPSL